MAEAMFDYAPQHVGDLALRVGDKVEVSRKGEDGWWSGTLRGQQGNFPGEFITLRHYLLHLSRRLCLLFLLLFTFLPFFSCGEAFAGYFFFVALFRGTYAISRLLVSTTDP